MKLIVIDMQKALLVDALYNRKTVTENIAKLIKFAREYHVEVIYVQHDAGPGSGSTVGDEGFEITDEVAPLPGEKVFVKKLNSAFSNREFAEYLEASDEMTLMIVGLATNYCIDASVKSAFDRHYDIVIPEGTNSTYDNPYMTGETTYNYYMNDVWPDLFADCVSMDDAFDWIKNQGYLS